MFRRLKTEEYRANVRRDDESPRDTLIGNKERNKAHSESQDDTLWLATQSNDAYTLINENDIEYTEEDISMKR